MACQWKKLDPNTTQQFPVRLSSQDVCYYAREYTSGASYKDSEANQDITNLKKHPRYRQTNSWYYKNQAIKKFAQELSEILGPAHVSAIPTSKTPDDEEYDSRLEDVLQIVSAIKPAVTIQHPFRLRQSHQSAHLGGKRSEQSFYDLLEWVGFLGEPNHIVLIDDVLTTGSHFNACKRLIQENHPGFRVFGIFWVKVVWKEPEPEIEF